MNWESTKNKALIFAAFWVFVVAVVFWRQWDGSLRNWDEGLTAERSREMLESGKWLTPSLFGQPDFNKPPLYYTLTAGTMMVIGQNEFAVRFWSMIFGIGCIVAVWRIGLRVSGNVYTGLLCALFLATSPYWINKVREGLLDSGMILGFLLAALFVLYGEGNTKRGIFGGLAGGLGSLIKGPFAIIVYLLAPIDRRLNDDKEPPWPRLGLAFGVFVFTFGAWFLIQWTRWGSDFIDHYVGYNLLQRASAPIEGQGDSSLYYIGKSLSLAPVGCLYLAMSIVVMAIYRDFPRRILWWGIMLVMSFLAISVVPNKREVYLMAPIAFAAIFSGVVLGNHIQKLGHRNRVIAVGTVAIISLIGFFSGYDDTPDHSRGAKEAALYYESIAKPGDRVAHYRRPPHLFMYYTQRDVEQIDTVEESIQDGRSFVFVHEDEEEAFIEEAGHSGIDLDWLFEDGDFLLVRVRNQFGLRPSAQVYQIESLAFLRPLIREADNE